MFEKQYRVVQVLKDYKSKITSIVSNSQGKYFICKKINVNNAQNENYFQQLKKIKHPNIVAICDLIIQNDYIYVVQEYCQQGDLAFHMHRRNKRKGRYYPEQTIAKWILQAIMGLQYLHKKNIYHQDIRLDNIYLTAQGYLKLGLPKLFNVINFLKQHGQKQKGLNLGLSLLVSPLYSAPEFLQKKVYDQKSDIWALACILQQLCTLKNNNVVQNAQRIIKGKIQALPLIYSEQLNQIYTNCLQNNSSQRPSTHQLLSNQYFLGYLKQIVKKDSTNNNQLSTRRIPIKKYKIHKQNQQKSKIEQLKTISLQKKQSGQTTMSSILLKKPSLQQNRNKKQIKTMSSKQDQPYNIKIQAIKQVQKSVRYNFDRKSSIQMRKQRQRLPEIKHTLVRSKSRQVSKRNSLNKNIQNQKSETLLQSQFAIGNQMEKSIQNPIQLSNSINNNNAVNSNQSPKKILHPPKPPRRKISHNSGTDMKSSQKFEQKSAQIIILKQLQLSKSQYKQKGKLEQSIKSSVQKITTNLLSVSKNQHLQQQISFELDDDDDIRLTSAKNQSQQLVDAYKTKLEELIKWMQCKYSPNMQTIMERTLEMDTTTFQKLKI